MNADGAKLLVYFADEEHLVRRLGAAIVSCWKEIPHPIRIKLIERAKRVIDEDESDEFDDQITRFIADHDGNSRHASELRACQ